MPREIRGKMGFTLPLDGVDWVCIYISTSQAMIRLNPPIEGHTMHILQLDLVILQAWGFE